MSIRCIDVDYRSLASYVTQRGSPKAHFTKAQIVQSWLLNVVTDLNVFVHISRNEDFFYHFELYYYYTYLRTIDISRDIVR